MSEESGVETAPQPQAQRLTLQWARMALIWQLCCTLFVSGFGLYLLYAGSETGAAFCCLGAVISATSLPRIWKQYRLVRSGIIVTVRPQVASQLARVPPAAAIMLTSLMTLMVLIAGAGTLYILPLASWSFIVKMIFAGFHLLLWLITGFLWYRIATEQRRITVVEPVYEQGDGVWPPAPQVPKIK